MARFFGPIGFSETVDSGDGVWTEKPLERNYYGDITRNVRKWENGTNENDNFVINNMISIIADDYILQHTYAIRYIYWMGAKWKITNIEVLRPRLVLTIGGVYNG